MIVSVYRYSMSTPPHPPPPTPHPTNARGVCPTSATVTYGPAACCSSIHLKPNDDPATWVSDQCLQHPGPTPGGGGVLMPPAATRCGPHLNTSSSGVARMQTAPCWDLLGRGSQFSPDRGQSAQTRKQMPDPLYHRGNSSWYKGVRQNMGDKRVFTLCFVLLFVVKTEKSPKRHILGDHIIEKN